MRRVLLVLGVLAVVAGAVVVVLGRDPSAPFPSEAELRVHGFAVWPADTVEEAQEECAGAEDWRLEARATALRFARDILRYPDPIAGDAFGEEVHHARLLINTRGIDELFLGSVLELDRYGRCWYVTEAEPREGELTATLGFVHRDGRTHLLLSRAHGLPHGYVGYGDWETEIDPGLRSTVMWMPEIDPDATGHVLYTDPDERGVSEIAGARPLGRIPEAAEGPPADPLDLSEVVGDAEVCRAVNSHRTPEAAIRDLFRWTFPELLEQREGRPHYERRTFHHLSGDTWRVVVDDAVLDATIPEIAGRCHAIVAMTPVDRDPPLRRLWVDEAGVTPGIDWGGGDEVSFSVAGAAGTLKQIREPVTFARGPAREGPLLARVILYEDGHVVSAYYGLFEP